MATKRNRRYEPAQFLKSQGFVKSGDKYINPLTNRKLSKQSALNKAANVLGWKSYDRFREAYTKPAKGQTITAYERFAHYARSKGLATGLGTKFDLLFKAAYNTNPSFKPRSKELNDLLTYVGKRNKRTKYAAGESPRKQRKRV